MDLPVAFTENVAVCPTATVWLTGWFEIVGASTPDDEDPAELVLLPDIPVHPDCVRVSNKTAEKSSAIAGLG